MPNITLNFAAETAEIVADAPIADASEIAKFLAVHAAWLNELVLEIELAGIFPMPSPSGKGETQLAFEFCRGTQPRLAFVGTLEHEEQLGEAALERLVRKLPVDVTRHHVFVALKSGGLAYLAAALLAAEKTFLSSESNVHQGAIETVDMYIDVLVKLSCAAARQGI